MKSTGCTIIYRESEIVLDENFWLPKEFYSPTFPIKTSTTSSSETMDTSESISPISLDFLESISPISLDHCLLMQRHEEPTSSNYPQQPSHILNNNPDDNLQKIQSIIENQSDPRGARLFSCNFIQQLLDKLRPLFSLSIYLGKFLRDLNLSAVDALRLDLMDFLESAPRKERKRYGKRKKLSISERSEIARQRNREHAKATRERRKVFAQIIERNLELLDPCVLEYLESSTDFKSAMKTKYRRINVEKFFAYSDTNVSFNEEAWMQLLLKGARFTTGPTINNQTRWLMSFKK